MRRRLRFERPRLGSAERRGRPAVRGLRPTPPIRSCSLGGAQLRNGGVFKQTAPPPFTLLDWGNVTVRERAVDLMQAAGARQLSASVLSREKLEQRKRSAIVHELTYLLDDVLYAMNNSNLADVQTVSRDCY